MKKHGKFLTAAILIVALALSVLAACSGGKTGGDADAVVTLKSGYVAEYRVGDNVDFYDFIERDTEQEYSFKVQKEGEDGSTDVIGRTYYAASSGKYKVEITAKRGEKTDTKTADFNVFEAVPFVRLNTPEFRMNYLRRVKTEFLISSSAPYIKGSNYKRYCDYATYYEDAESDGTVIRLDGDATTDDFDGFYDGVDTVTFVKEGIFVFHLIVENSGGYSDANFTVSVYEDFSGIKPISGASLDYDKTTKTAVWSEVAEAADYRVKVERKEIIVPASQASDGKVSTEITSALVNDFQDFTLVVTPRKADGTVIGKIEKYIIVAPEKYGDLVLSQGTKGNAATGEFVLNGRRVPSMGWSSGIHAIDNTYVAWSGSYGLNTFVEFEFTGNNMPQLCFFADEINGDMSQKSSAEEQKAKGILLIGGMYGPVTSGEALFVEIIG